MPINASHEFFEAEKKYLAAQNVAEKIACLEEMIRKAPKHKGSENLLAELRLRLKKLKGKREKLGKAGKGKKGIRKEGYMICLIGKVNSGKSSLLSSLTRARSYVSDVAFTTKEPVVGTMYYEGVKSQVVDLPSVESKEFDYNLLNSSDLLLIVIERLSDLEKILEKLKVLEREEIVVLNKVDLLDVFEIRKIEERCKSKRLNFVLISTLSGHGIKDLKEKIFRKMKVIRIYTKVPGKKQNEEPVVLKEGCNVKDVAENIYKGFSKQIKEIRLTGPSGKFVNQRVGLNHILKDKDVVEFKTK
jgi:uncharacterized protein